MHNVFAYTITIIQKTLIKLHHLLLSYLVN